MRQILSWNRHKKIKLTQIINRSIQSQLCTQISPYYHPILPLCNKENYRVCGQTWICILGQSLHSWITNFEQVIHLLWSLVFSSITWAWESIPREQMEEVNENVCFSGLAYRSSTKVCSLLSLMTQPSLKEKFVLSSIVLREHPTACPYLALLWDFWCKSLWSSHFPARQWAPWGSKFGLLLLFTSHSPEHWFSAGNPLVLDNNYWCFFLIIRKLNKKTFECTDNLILLSLKGIFSLCWTPQWPSI